MSLGLVNGGRASQHGGGTWACGWYMKTHTRRHETPKRSDGLKTYLCLRELIILIIIIF